MMVRNADTIVLGILAIVVGVILILTSGCGSAISTARRTVLASTEVVAATDSELTNRYAHFADEARDESTTGAEYVSRMRLWDDVHEAQQIALAGLRSAESAIDVWERTDDGAPFTAIIGCVTRAVKRLLMLMEAAGLTFPALVRNTSELLSQYLSANCEARP